MILMLPRLTFYVKMYDCSTGWFLLLDYSL